MTGNPEVVVVINDAWQKGIRGFDSEKAYEYAVNTTLKSGNSKLGYCRESISDTTEYGLDEWNVSQFAAALGKKDDAAKYWPSPSLTDTSSIPIRPGPTTPPAPMPSRSGRACSVPRTAMATSCPGRA